MTTSDFPPDPDDSDVVYERLSPVSGTAHNPYWSLRRMGFGAFTVILAVVLFFTVFASLHRTAKPATSQANVLHPATLDQIAVIANVPWGSVSLDGKVVAQLPDIQGNNALHLTHGRHTITLVVAPFIPQSCVLSIPLAVGDTCQESALSSNASQPVVPIYFAFSLQQLPPAQQQALQQAAQTAVNELASTATILPGEYYQAGAMQAPQALRGTLHFSLDTSGNAAPFCAYAEEYCRVNTQDCWQFCSVVDSVVPLDQPNLTWHVFGVALPQWDYATPDGHPTAVNQPDAYGGAAGYEGLLPLDIRWTGSTWHVNVAPFDPTLLSATVTDKLVDIGCASAQNTLEVSPLVPPAILGPVTIGWQYRAARQRAQGCLVTAIPAVNGATPTTPATAYLLYHFGSLVAVNAVAHRYWPTIPQADANERAIAASLGAQG